MPHALNQITHKAIETYQSPPPYSVFPGVLATSSEALTGSPHSQAVLGSCGESEDAVFFQCSLMAFPRPCEVPEAHGKTSLCDKISPSLARDRSSLENGGKRTIFCFAGRVHAVVVLSIATTWALLRVRVIKKSR